MRKHAIRSAVPAAALAAGLAVAGCGSAHAGNAAAGKTAAAAAAASKAPTCYDKEQTWAHGGGGLRTLNALKGDTGAISHELLKVARVLGSYGDTTSVAGTLGADASQLAADARSGSLNPPPACSGRGQFILAMSDYQSAGSNFQQASSGIASQDLVPALTYVKAGLRNLRHGNNEMDSATAAIPSA